MPINPLYNFTNEQADLGSGAFAAGNALWQGPQPGRVTPPIPGGITPDIRQAVLMGRQSQPQPAAPVAPAPVAAPRVAPQTPRSQILEQDLPPEQFAPQESSQIIESDLPPEQFVEPDHTPARPDFSEYEQTTLAKRGRDMGFDPRSLMVALAEFSAGMGNINGKPQQSTARSFYQMQKQEEAQADAGRRADEAQRRQDMAFERSLRPKPMDPTMKAYYEAQTQAALKKGTPDDMALTEKKLRIALLQKQLDQEVDPTKRRTAELQLQKLERELNPTPPKPGEVQTLTPEQVKNTTDFRKQYASDKTTVASIDAKNTWNRAKVAMESDSPAGQIAAVYSFMKSLDPTSTVRESEYATAESARAAIDSATNYANKIQSGKRLTAEQVRDFRGIMEKLYKRQMLEQKAKNDEYRRLAKRYGVAEEDIGLIPIDEAPLTKSQETGARGYKVWAP
jgi:hypothetical protein